MEQNILKINKTQSDNGKIRFTPEFCYTILLGLIWTNSTLVTYFKAILLRIPGVSAYREQLITFIFLVFILFSIPYIIRNVKPLLIFLYVAICVIYMLNFVIFPQNKVVLQNFTVTFLLKSLPLIFIGVSLDIKKHYKLLYCLSVISVIVKFFQILRDPVYMSNGDMHSSYLLLPHVCMVLVTAIGKPGIFNISLSAIGVIIIFAFGSRGPVICLLILSLAYLLIVKKANKNSISYLVLVVSILGIVLFYEDILQFLLRIIDSMGMSTRVIELSLQGEAFDLNGRDRIQEVIIQAIKENWLGYGIAADRTIVGSYSHNIILEFLVSYGVLFGLILFIVPVFFLVKLLLKKAKNACLEDGFILVLVSSSFIKLFMSSSYLTESFLFLLIGVAIAEYKKEFRSVDKSTVACDIADEYLE